MTGPSIAGGSRPCLLVAIVLLSAFEATQLAVRLALPTWSVPWHALLVRTLVSWGVLVLLSIAVWHLALRVPVPPVSARALLTHGAAMTLFVLLHILVANMIKRRRPFIHTSFPPRCRIGRCGVARRSCFA